VFDGASLSSCNTWSLKALISAFLGVSFVLIDFAWAASVLIGSVLTGFVLADSLWAGFVLAISRGF